MPIVNNKDLKKKKQLTPEEEAAEQKRKQEAQDYLRQREKEKGKLMESGATSKQAEEQANKNVTSGKMASAEEAGQVTMKESQEFLEKSSALDEQQIAERNKLTDEQLSLEKQTDSITRLSQAGLIPITAASNMVLKLMKKNVYGLDIKTTTAEAEVKNPVSKLFGLAAAIPTLAYSSLFTYNRDNAREMASDASTLKGNARLEVTNVKSRGADVDTSLANLRKIEAAIRARYGDAALSLKSSPTDIAAGIDYQDEMFSDLNVVMGYRQVLERYQLTGNFAELQNFYVEGENPLPAE